MAEQLRIDPADAKGRVDVGDAIILDVVSPMAWEQLDRLRPDSDAGAWLWRLATNVVLNSMRSDRRRLARVAAGRPAAGSRAP